MHAMEVIDRLEPSKRVGIYGGACGYLSFAGRHGSGDCDPYRRHQGQRAHVQAAAGVVADSVPELEWEETG